MAESNVSILISAKDATSQAFSSVKAQLLGVGVTLAGVGYAMKSVIDTYSAYEEAFVGLRQSAELSNEELDKLNKELIDLSSRKPMNFIELTQIADQLTTIGVRGVENLMKLTEGVEDLNAATGLNVNSIIGTYELLMKQMGLTADDFDNFGSALDEASDKVGASIDDINGFIRATASMAASNKINIQGLITFGTTFSKLGLGAGEASLVFNRSMLTIKNAVKEGGEDLMMIAEISGMSVRDFKKLWEEDATQALTKFMQGISKNYNKYSSSLSDLGLVNNRTAKTFAALSKEGVDFNEVMGLVNTAFEDSNAMADDASIKYTTFNSEFEVLKNNFDNFKNDLGKELVPTLKETNTWLIENMDTIKNMTVWTIDLLGGIVKFIKFVGASIYTAVETAGHGMEIIWEMMKGNFDKANELREKYSKNIQDDLDQLNVMKDDFIASFVSMADASEENNEKQIDSNENKVDAIKAANDKSREEEKAAEELSLKQRLEREKENRKTLQSIVDDTYKKMESTMQEFEQNNRDESKASADKIKELNQQKADSYTEYIAKIEDLEAEHKDKMLSIEEDYQTSLQVIEIATKDKAAAFIFKNEAELSKKTKELKKEERKLDKLMRKEEELESENAIESRIENQNAVLDGLDSQLKALDSLTDQDKESIATQKQSYKDQIEQNKEILKGLQDKLSENQKNRQEIENNIKAGKEHVSGIKDDLSVLKKEQETYKDDMKGLVAELSEAKRQAGLTEYQRIIENAETEKAKLTEVTQQKLQEEETRIQNTKAQLQKEFNEKQQIINKEIEAEQSKIKTLKNAYDTYYKDILSKDNEFMERYKYNREQETKVAIENIGLVMDEYENLVNTLNTTDSNKNEYQKAYEKGMSKAAAYRAKGDYSAAAKTEALAKEYLTKSQNYTNTNNGFSLGNVLDSVKPVTGGMVNNVSINIAAVYGEDQSMIKRISNAIVDRLKTSLKLG